MSAAELFATYGIVSAVIAAAVSVLWLIGTLLRDHGIVDVFWGVGFVIIAWGTFILSPDADLWRRILVAALVSAWGLRLTLHILIRNWGRGEDFRYRAFRQRAGSKWWWFSYLKVYLLQGAIMLVVAAPVVFAVNSPQALRWWEYLFVAVWLIGFAFEAGGDLQLALFRRKPGNKGRLLTTGFWAWTRHPNYFGDAVQWWAYYLLAVGSGAWGAVTIFSPLLMTFLLVRVSGVRLLERTMVQTKPGYIGYVRSTSSFLPLPPGTFKSARRTGRRRR